MKVLLAVDGGQSSTTCLITDLNGKMLGIGKGGPSNHVKGKKGKKRLEKALQDSIGEAVSKIEEDFYIKKASLGMTGVAEKSQYVNIIKNVTKQLVDAETIDVYSDAKIVWAGATGCQPGVCVYAGTGSIALGVDKNNNTEVCGGWGHIIDDVGGGYKIALKAIKSSFRSYDGYGEKTNLEEALLSHFKTESHLDFRNKLYSKEGISRDKIATFSKKVSKIADLGDNVATNILKGSGKILGKLVLCVKSKLNSLDKNFKYTATGGVLQSKTIEEEIIATVQDEHIKAHYNEPIYDPVIGAVLLAFQNLNLDLNKDRIDNLNNIEI